MDLIVKFSALIFVAVIYGIAIDCAAFLPGDTMGLPYQSRRSCLGDEGDMNNARCLLKIFPCRILTFLFDFDNMTNINCNYSDGHKQIERRH